MGTCDLVEGKENGKGITGILKTMSYLY